MITVVLLTLLSAITVRRLAPKHHLLAWAGPLIGLLLLSLFGIEVVVRGTEPFISDENYYMAEGQTASLSDAADRYLWVLLNAVVLRYDFGLGGVPLKLVNLPLLALFVALVWRIFDRERLVWLFPVVMPYAAYLATFNLRDTAILAATAACVFFLDSRRPLRRLMFLPAIGTLYLLRPPIAFASALVWLAVVAGSGLRAVARGRIPWKAVAVVGGGMVAVAALFWEPLLLRAQRYYVWYEYALGEGFAERALERGLASDYLTGSWKARIIEGAARYAVAPLPTSLLFRILDGGSEQWGLLDDVVRMIHQTTYYVVLVWLVVRWRYLVRAAKSLSRGQVMLLLALGLYFPAYSIYHFGLSHQRVKIPFQLAIFLFALVVYRTRRRHGQTTRNNGSEDDGARVRRPSSQGNRVAVTSAVPGADRTPGWQ